MDSRICFVKVELNNKGLFKINSFLYKSNIKSNQNTFAFGMWDTKAKIL